MLQIGCFSEHYGADYPAFSAERMDMEKKTAVAAYMRKGRVFAVAPGHIRDVFSGEIIRGDTLAYMDGEYYWGSETIYYFEKYDLMLPKEFVQKAIAKSN